MIDCAPPSPEFLQEQLGGASKDEANLFALANMFGQIQTNLARALQFYADRFEMSVLDGQALFIIAELGDSARPGTIAERLKMPLSTMTGVANRLVSAGLVDRRPAPDDGRAAILVITEAGTERIQQLFQPVIRDVGDILAEYGPDALQQILEGFSLVESITATLEARVKAKSAKG